MLRTARGTKDHDLGTFTELLCVTYTCYLVQAQSREYYDHRFTDEKRIKEVKLSWPKSHSRESDGAGIRTQVCEVLQPRDSSLNHATRF